MIRGIGIALAGTVLAGGALLSFSALAELPADHAFCRAGLCGPGTSTPANHPLNPFGWCDLAEDRANAGDLTGARQAFDRAVKLGPNVPPVLIRVVNFEVANGQLSQVLPLVHRILVLTPSYDGILFRYLIRSSIRLTESQSNVIHDPGMGSAEESAKGPKLSGGHASAPDGGTRGRGDAARAWVSYLIAERHADAEAAWRWLEERKGVTPELRIQWIEYLVNGKKAFAEAQAVWASGTGEAGYPEKNRIFNTGFEREFAGTRMDWTVSPNPHVAAKREGGLTLVFDGKDNVAYANVTQQTYVPAGRWRFEAEAEADGLTTNKRPYFRIYDTFDPRRLDAATPMAPERMAVDFMSPAGGSWVTVMLLRQQSEKFDNQISGTLRIRQVRIRGVNGGA